MKDVNVATSKERERERREQEEGDSYTCLPISSLDTATAVGSTTLPSFFTRFTGLDFLDDDDDDETTATPFLLQI
jgi:hypothetical protein